MELPSRQQNQMGDVKEHVHRVAEEIYEIWRPDFIWGRSSGSSGEHPLGLALDFSVLEYGGGVNNPGPARAWMGNEIAQYLWANRRRLNIWYIIWSRRIISTNPDSYAANEWTKYRGTNPHTDHVHVSFYSNRTYEPPPPVPKPEPKPEPIPDWWDTVDDTKFIELTEQAIENKRDWIAAGVLNDLIPTGIAHLDGNGGRPIGWHLRTTRNRVDAIAVMFDRFAGIVANRFAEGTKERQELQEMVAQLRALLEDEDSA